MTKEEIIEYKKRLNENFSKISSIEGMSPPIAESIVHDITIIEHLRSKGIHHDSLSNGSGEKLFGTTGILNLKMIKDGIDNAIGIMRDCNCTRLEEIVGYGIYDGFMSFHSSNGNILSVTSPSSADDEDIVKSLNHLRDCFGLPPLVNMKDKDKE